MKNRNKKQDINKTFFPKYECFHYIYNRYVQFEYFEYFEGLVKV